MGVGIMDIAKKIRTARERLKYSQLRLANAINVDKNTVWRWEKQKTEPTAVEISNLAAALETSVAYLMGETDDPKNPSAPPTVNIGNISTNEPNSSQNVLTGDGNNNVTGDGNTVTNTQVPRGTNIKSMSYWGEVADEAEKVAERHDPKEIHRVVFVLREALSAVESARESYL
jgi:DNA-binding XRE family transcriptional regulator